MVPKPGAIIKLIFQAFTMKRQISILGLVCVGIFIFVAYVCIHYALTCSGFLCGVSIVLPSLPWFFLISNFIGLEITNTPREQIPIVEFVYVLGIVINLFLAYIIGYALQRVCMWIKAKY